MIPTFITSLWVSYSLVSYEHSHICLAVLHSQHKLAYFRNAKWLECWITDAEMLVCFKFKSYYATLDNDSDNEVTTISSIEQDSTSNIFDQLDALAPPKPSDMRCEIDCYLSVDIEHVTDALGWWYKWCTVYLRLSRMAHNYLSVPGTFTESFIIY